MAPFKFGKKKHSEKESGSPASQKAIASSPHGSTASSSAGNPNASFTAVSFNTTISPGRYRDTGSNDQIPPHQQQSNAAIGYDHNNNIYNPRSPQSKGPPATPPGSAGRAFPHTKPQHPPQYGSPQLEKSTPWSRSKLLISPFPRYRHAASTIANEKGEIFVMGGLHNTSVYGDTWIIKQDELGSFQTFQVDIYENSPAPRVGHASTLCGNAYVIFGGDTVTNDAGEIDNDLYLFNMNSHTWTIPNPVGVKPPGRYGHSIGVIAITNFESKLYLYGGQLDDIIYDELVVFNLSSFRRPDVQWENVKLQSDVRPPPLTNHTMDVYDNKLWIFGGSTGHALLNDLWRFNPLIGTWDIIHTTGATPPPLEEHASVVYKDLLIINGGKTIAGELSPDCFILNLNSLVWFQLPTGLDFQCEGKYGHSISILKNGRLLLLGGHTPDYAKPGEDLEPSVEDHGVGTILYTLDLTSLSKYIPGLYQHGTPSRPKNTDEFQSFQGSHTGKHNNIFTPPVQHQTSPTKDVIINRPDGSDTKPLAASALAATATATAVVAATSKASSVGTRSASLSSQQHTPRVGTSAEEAFQHEYQGSPKSAINETPVKQSSFDIKTPVPNNQRSEPPNEFASPEEELPLDLPSPISSQSRAHKSSLSLVSGGEKATVDRDERLLFNQETTMEPLQGTSYLNPDSRVSDFFDGYITNESQLNFDEKENQSPVSIEQPVEDSKALKSSIESHLNTCEAKSSLEKATPIKTVSVSKSADISTLGALQPNPVVTPAIFRVPKADSNSDHGIDLGTATVAGIGVMAGAAKVLGRNNDADFAKSKSIEASNGFNGPQHTATSSTESEKEQFKKIVEELSIELETLKVKTNEQARDASERMKQLELENEDLKAKVVEQSQSKNVLEHDPEQVTGTEDDIKRKFIRLTADYELLNEKHTILQRKVEEVEPIFSVNLVNLQTLNANIKSLELKLTESETKLKAQEDWKLKHDELNLKYESLECKLKELVENPEKEETKDESDTKKLTAALDALLARYAIIDDETNELKSKELFATGSPPNTATSTLHTQLDELLAENEETRSKFNELSKEVETLRSENEEIAGLKAKLADFSKIEENYKASLSSVRNTSKALQVSQSELSKQKEVINDLKREVDELKIFKGRKMSRNTTPIVNDLQTQSNNSDDERSESEDIENEHFNLKIRDLQAELFITKQDNEDLKQEILTLKKRLLVTSTPANSF